MIRAVLQAALRLAGQADPRLWRGLLWAMLEGLFAALPYLLLSRLLVTVLLPGPGAAMRLAFTGSEVLGYAVAMLVCLALRIVCGMRGMPLIFAAAYAMMAQARLRIAEHLRQLPLGWFSQQRNGDLSARLTSDIDLIEQLWSHFLGSFVSGLTMSCALLLLLLYLDWQLALFSLVLLPLAALLLARTQQRMTAPGSAMLAASTALQAALLEYIEGIAVIRSFGRFGSAWRQLERILQDQHDAMLALERQPAPWVAGFGLLLELGLLLLLAAGAWRIAAGTLSPALLLVFLLLTLPLYRQLFELGLASLLLRFARSALQRVEQLLAQPALAEPDYPATPRGQHIVFERVCFSYDLDTRSAAASLTLQNLSCVFPAQTLTAIVGPSGAGKSTLVHLIARLWDVSSGAIRIGGVDLRQIGSQVLHQQVAMVFQEVLLFSGTVLDNLRIGRHDASRAEVIAVARCAGAHDFISALPQGYDTPLDEAGASLSGGQRQCIAIARALLKDAPILLLDEATASIDPSAAADIQRALAALTRGRTVIVIAHQLHSVRHADQILVLDAGRLVGQGRHAQLLARCDLYRRMWQRQQQARDWQLASGFGAAAADDPG